MADIVYPLGFQKVMTADIDLNDGATVIKAVLVKSASYTYAQGHEFFSSVPGGARCTGGTGTLANKVVNRSTNLLQFDGDDIVLSSVPDGQGSFDLLIVYKDTGVEATSPLLGKFDISPAITPNGGNITLQIHANGLIEVTCTGA
jgi:hypothetical protein